MAKKERETIRGIASLSLFTDPRGTWPHGMITGKIS